MQVFAQELHRVTSGADFQVQPIIAVELPLGHAALSRLP